MLCNVKLTIAYDGTAYAGWQRQRDALTIQQLLEEALERILGQKVVLHGAGRTDAGVHAAGMVASLQAPKRLPLPAYRRGLNSMLPPDVRVLAAEEVEPGFHARFSARGKTYRYCFATTELMEPCRRLYWAHVPGPFAAEAVVAALPCLLGEHDFSAFEAAGSRQRVAGAESGRGRGAVRRLTRLDLLTENGYLPGVSGGNYCLVVAGDGFLRHMVRNIVGTLIEIGRGKRDPDSLAGLLAARERTLAGPTAPACGLTLWHVEY